VPTTRSKWELSREALARLLETLDADSDAAGKKYIALRTRLTDLFAWQRCDSPEDLADETLNRVARKLSENHVIQNLGSYALGVARMIVHEARRSEQEKRAAIRELKIVGGQAKQESDLLETVRRCLASLPAGNRRLIERYYAEDLEALAREEGISVNALRNRALRIREKLFECVTRNRDIE
jgi:DNA-directed RNA polymerase specialized sigma24 family protein